MDASLPPTSSTAKKNIAIPAKVLQGLVKKQISGRLTIYDPNDDSVQWRVYIGNGKIHYATSLIGQRERFAYLLKQYLPSLPTPSPDEFTSDYHSIYQILESKQLSMREVRQLLFRVTQEACIHSLALPRAAVQFDKKLGLDPLLLSVAINPVILPIRARIRAWVQLRSEISSPFQRPYIENPDEITDMSWIDSREYEIFKSIKNALEQNLCLYEVAARSNKTTLELAKFLQPFVKAGVVRMNPYQPPQQDERPIIACIDDSKAIQRIVKLTLEASGFRVIGLEEPAQALTTLVRSKPALVLMDINMPGIDGYELCRMFQQSTLLRDIPIIMLTGRDGIIDRIRARMVGAVNYISKPFHPHELVSLVQSKLSSGHTGDENSSNY
jgi:twitching motility two-component system response regulator PilG